MLKAFQVKKKFGFYDYCEVDPILRMKTTRIFFFMTEQK